MNSFFFLIIGPAGAGKGTLISTFRERHPEFFYPLSATTRPMREGEKDGVTYHFVSDAEFDRLIAADELLEWATIHHQQRSGILKKPVLEALASGKNVMREVEILGGWPKLKASEIASHIKSIFLTVPDEETIRQRITSRSSLSDAEVERRMQTSREELKHVSEADIQIICYDGQQEQIYRQAEEFVMGVSGNNI